MLNEALSFLNDSLALKGVRRVLWFFLVVIVFVTFFEVQTNYFEIHSISTRLELVEKVGQQPLSAEQNARIEKIKNDLLNEIEAVQAERISPSAQYSKILIRFIKGAWITIFPSGIIITVTILLFFKSQKSQDFKILKEKIDAGKNTLWFGCLCLSCVVWAATILGLASMIWNTGISMIFSWFVFPTVSAFVFLIIAIWIALLRAILSKESKIKSDA